MDEYLDCLDYGNVDEVDKTTFKLCSEEGFYEIKESINGKCGEKDGKCPSEQCCNKDGECTENKDQCFVTKGCQYKYGQCSDECEELVNNVDIDKRGSIGTCVVDKNGRINQLNIYGEYIDDMQNVIDIVSKYTDIEILNLNEIDIENTDFSDFKTLKILLS